VLVADTGNDRIRRITGPNAVSTLAGDMGAGYADGPAAAARFSRPQGVAGDAAGTIYIADTGNARIRLLAPDGMVMTLAGSGKDATEDGPGAASAFHDVVALAVTPDGVVMVAETFWIRRVTRPSP